MNSWVVHLLCLLIVGPGLSSASGSRVCGTWCDSFVCPATEYGVFSGACQASCSTFAQFEGAPLRVDRIVCATPHSFTVLNSNVDPLLLEVGQCYRVALSRQMDISHHQVSGSRTSNPICAATYNSDTSFPFKVLQGWTGHRTLWMLNISGSRCLTASLEIGVVGTPTLRTPVVIPGAYVTAPCDVDSVDECCKCSVVCNLGAACPPHPVQTFAHPCSECRAFSMGPRPYGFNEIVCPTGDAVFGHTVIANDVSVLRVGRCYRALFPTTTTINRLTFSGPGATAGVCRSTYNTDNTLPFKVHASDVNMTTVWFLRSIGGGRCIWASRGAPVKT